MKLTLVRPTLELKSKELDYRQEHSAEYKRKCKEVCSEQEYTILEKAFFNKENNLKKQ
jgi:hypothetical protein